MRLPLRSWNMSASGRPPQSVILRLTLVFCRGIGMPCRPAARKIGSLKAAEKSSIYSHGGMARLWLTVWQNLFGMRSIRRKKPRKYSKKAAEQNMAFDSSEYWEVFMGRFSQRAITTGDSRSYRRADGCDILSVDPLQRIWIIYTLCTMN